MTQDWPTLYSFRRCPYAMRARLALAVSGQSWVHREVDLRQRPPELRAASPKASVPVLVLADGQVIDESLEIMAWTLERRDPEGWLREGEEREWTRALIARCDGEFKGHLDRYKYAERYADARPSEERELASAFVLELEQRLAHTPFLLGAQRSLADMAIAPFVRQLAGADSEWFEGQPWSAVQAWLGAFCNSPLFTTVMGKYAPWNPGAAPCRSPGSWPA